MDNFINTFCSWPLPTLNFLGYKYYNITLKTRQPQDPEV